MRRGLPLQTDQYPSGRADPLGDLLAVGRTRLSGVLREPLVLGTQQPDLAGDRPVRTTGRHRGDGARRHWPPRVPPRLVDEVAIDRGRRGKSDRCTALSLRPTEREIDFGSTQTQHVRPAERDRDGSVALGWIPEELDDVERHRWSEAKWSREAPNVAEKSASMNRARPHEKARVRIPSAPPKKHQVRAGICHPEPEDEQMPAPRLLALSRRLCKPGVAIPVPGRRR